MVIKNSSKASFSINKDARLVVTVDAEGHAVVAYEEGVFFYRPHERGPCYVIDGPKIHLSCCGGYMIVVSNKTGSRMQLYDLSHKFVAATLSLRGSAGMRAVAKGTVAGESKSSARAKKGLSPGAAMMAAMVQAGGVGGMSAADSARLNAAMRGDGDIMHIVSCCTGEGGGSMQLFIVTTTHRVYALREKTLNKRLNELFQKHLYI